MRRTCGDAVIVMMMVVSRYVMKSGKGDDECVMSDTYTLKLQLID